MVREAHIHSELGGTAIIAAYIGGVTEHSSVLLRQSSNNGMDDVGLHVMGEGSFERAIYLAKVLADTLNIELLVIQVYKLGESYAKLHISPSDLDESGIKYIKELIRKGTENA